MAIGSVPHAVSTSPGMAGLSAAGSDLGLRQAPCGRGRCRPVALTGQELQNPDRGTRGYC